MRGFSFGEVALVERVPVEIVVVEKLWPPGTIERVSLRRINWSADYLYLLNVSNLAHALFHCHQRERLGWRYLPLWVWDFIRAGFRHDRHRMENEARAAESDEFYRSWAADLIHERENWEAA